MDGEYKIGGNWSETLTSQRLYKKKTSTVPFGYAFSEIDGILNLL